ncbi:MAG: pyrroline-5-carboxylate reductase dimerization domain-containing protein, partial [Clostridia bacterium]
SLFMVASIGCSKPPNTLQNNTHTEPYKIYEQGGKYFLGKDVPKDYKKAFSTSEYIIIAVKPYQVKEVLDELVNSGADWSRSVFISICASVPTKYITNILHKDHPVIRIMPSTPIAVGKGTAAISKNSFTDKKNFEYICRVFSSICEVAVIDEEVQNSIISVNGSSPAYVYKLIKSMLDGAEEQGISPQSALPIILRTIEGAVEMVRKSGETPDSLIKKVSSPNGTTLAALEVLDSNNFEQNIKDAMKACTERANQISIELP